MTDTHEDWKMTELEIQVSSLIGELEQDDMQHRGKSEGVVEAARRRKKMYARIIQTVKDAQDLDKTPDSTERTGSLTGMTRFVVKYALIERRDNTVFTYRCFASSATAAIQRAQEVEVAKIQIKEVCAVEDGEEEGPEGPEMKGASCLQT